MSDRKFICAERGKYSLEEKDSLGKWFKRHNDSMMQKFEGDFKKFNCNGKMKKHTKKTPREEHFVRDVREFYPDLKEARHNDLDIQSAIKLGKKYYEQVIDNERRSEIDVEPSKSMLNNTKG